MNSKAIGQAKQVNIPKFFKVSDQGMVLAAQQGDMQAMEYLLYKYRGLVKTKVRSYFLMGAEKDDLIQIGMIGLWQSIIDYSPNSDVSFLSFARLCIERHIITAIKTATRRKQSPLNNAVSLENCFEEADGDFCLTDILLSDVELDPEELLLRRENEKRLKDVLKSLLSKFEWEVLKLYYSGKTYREIAIDLGCNTKSVDNALGRIKRKVLTASDKIYV